MLVKPLWSEIELIIAANVGKTLKLKANHVILGITHSERFSKTDLKHINLMLLVGKLCISKYKYGKKYDLLALFENEMRYRK